MLNGDVGTEKKSQVREFTNFTNLVKSESTAAQSNRNFTIKKSTQSNQASNRINSAMPVNSKRNLQSAHQGFKISSKAPKVYSAQKPSDLHDQMKNWLRDKIVEEDHIYNDYIKEMEESNLVLNFQ